MEGAAQRFKVRGPVGISGFVDAMVLLWNVSGPENLNGLFYGYLGFIDWTWLHGYRRWHEHPVKKARH
jgi:hypothetical protein